jgi:hypothetical protein
MRAMRCSVKDLAVVLIAAAATFGTFACQSGGGSNVTGNDGGSDPINEAESKEYKKAIVRCYKTGGTRVVKIMGTLRCY